MWLSQGPKACKLSSQLAYPFLRLPSSISPFPGSHSQAQLGPVSLFEFPQHPCILVTYLLILSIIFPYDPDHFLHLALCPPTVVGIEKIMVELNSHSNAKPLPIYPTDFNLGGSQSPSIFLEPISTFHRSCSPLCICQLLFLSR